jgi:hypothetical protein
MNSKNEPGRSPEKKVVLAFDAVDIRKEAGHKKRGDQQRQGSKTLVYQGYGQFSVRSRDGRALVAKAQNSFVM